MGFAVIKEIEKVRQGNPDLHEKNCVWGNFKTPNKTQSANRRQPLKTQQEKPTYAYKIASGRPIWPSRDPIEEAGGNNLYVFVGNDGLNTWDNHGLDFIAVGRRKVGGLRLLPGANHLSIEYFLLKFFTFCFTTQVCFHKFS